MPLAFSLAALATLAVGDQLPHLPLSPPESLPLPDSGKIAAYYSSSAKTLYVFHKQKLLTGIQDGTYTVEWNGQANFARVTVDGTSKRVKVDTTKTFQEAIGRLVRLGTDDTKLLMVFGSAIKDQPASLGPSQDLRSRLTTDNVPKTWRLAKRHVTYFHGDGHQSGQETLGICFRRYIYENHHGRVEEIGTEDYPPCFRLTEAEWPN